jgi:hypothetical protein
MASLSPSLRVTAFSIVFLAALAAGADPRAKADLNAFAGIWIEDLSQTAPRFNRR